jgi:hypothetical protein
MFLTVGRLPLTVGKLSVDKDENELTTIAYYRLACRFLYRQKFDFNRIVIKKTKKYFGIKKSLYLCSPFYIMDLVLR